MRAVALAIAGVGTLCVAAFMWQAGHTTGGGWLFVLGVALLLEVLS